ncbi:hypothetical protein ACHAXS_011287 [Conticribra weissflogii]
MSHEKASPPGVACKVVETVHHKAFMAVAMTLSTSVAVLQQVSGGKENNSSLNTVQQSMHPFINGISLLVFGSISDIFDIAEDESRQNQ